MRREAHLIVVIMLFVSVAAVYYRSAWSPFALIDDADYVTNNYHVTSGLSLQGVQWAFTTFDAGNWHPLTWLSLMTDSQIFGAHPLGFHCVNIALHALNAALLFFLMLSFSGALWRSAFVAALFAVHPLHVESVVWISERKDVLSMLFFLLTLITYRSYTLRGKPRIYVMSLAAFALGLMAKPMLVTTPFLLLLLDVWPLKRLKMPHDDAIEENSGNQYHAPARLLAEKLPYLLLSVVSALLTWYAHKAFILSSGDIPLLMRGSNMLWAMVGYVRKMLFPCDLALFYPIAPLPFWKPGCAAILLGVTTFLVVKYRRRYPYLAVGWFWFAISLIPVIGLVQVGNQAMADRYAYIPLIGLYMMISWGGAELYARVPKLKGLLLTAALASLLLLAGTAFVQSGYWCNNTVLSTHALEVTDSNYFAHFCLGLAYEKEGKHELALAQFNEAVKINPADSQSWFNIGLCMANARNYAGSVSYFAEAIRLNPRFAAMHYCLAITLAKLGKVDEALGEYGLALKLEPDNIKCLTNIGSLLAEQGRYDEAIPYFSALVRMLPNDNNARQNLELANRLREQATGR